MWKISTAKKLFKTELLPMILARRRVLDAAPQINGCHLSVGNGARLGFVKHTTISSYWPGLRGMVLPQLVQQRHKAFAVSGARQELRHAHGICHIRAISIGLLSHSLLHGSQQFGFWDHILATETFYRKIELKLVSPPH
jgi:hypothetical protein